MNTKTEIFDGGGQQWSRLVYFLRSGTRATTRAWQIEYEVEYFN